MKDWQKISSLLCFFGFLRELRPSEPYVTEFLLGPWRNITQEQLNREVYPVGTYSYLAQLVVVFLITDFLRYKPLIIAIGASGIIVWSCLLWTSTLEALQILEFFYGTSMAAEVAYYTYIYAKVDKIYYPQVTSHTRAAMLAGKLVASILAQVFVNLHIMDYRQLNYITLGGQISATLLALCLPKVDKSLYFHRDPQCRTAQCVQYKTKQQQPNDADNASVDDVKLDDAIGQPEGREEQHFISGKPMKLLWSHFCKAYTNLNVIRWSIWYALGLCGYMQVISYVQLLWKDIKPIGEIAWNGAVDAILTALAAISALIAGYVHIDRVNPLASLIVLSVFTVVEGGAILWTAWTNNIYISYAGYILFGALYAFTITLASTKVARYLEEESYALVFGINTMVALVLQTILTLVVVSEGGLALNATDQYTVYAFYFIIIGILYLANALIEYFIKKFCSEKANTVILSTN